MQKITLLIISSTLLLNACDHKIEEEGSKEANRAVLIDKTALKEVEQKKIRRVDSGLTLKKGLKNNKQSKVIVRSLPVKEEPVMASLDDFSQESDAVFSIDPDFEQEGLDVLEPLDNVTTEEENQTLNMDLDLSLNLDVVEHNNSLGRNRDRLLQGLFKIDEGIANIRLEAHFEGPHNENKERDTTPDGAGVGIEIGI